MVPPPSFRLIYWSMRFTFWSCCRWCFHMRISKLLTWRLSLVKFGLDNGLTIRLLSLFGKPCISSFIKLVVMPETVAITLNCLAKCSLKFTIRTCAICPICTAINYTAVLATCPYLWWKYSTPMLNSAIWSTWTSCSCFLPLIFTIFVSSL